MSGSEPVLLTRCVSKIGGSGHLFGPAPVRLDLGRPRAADADLLGPSIRSPVHPAHGLPATLRRLCRPLLLRLGQGRRLQRRWVDAPDLTSCHTVWVAGVLGWPARYCAELGRKLPVLWPGENGGYWMDADAAEVFAKVGHFPSSENAELTGSLYRLRANRAS